MLSDRFLRIKGCIIYICVFCVIAAFFILLFFASFKSSMNTAAGKICLSDFIDLLASGSFMNIFIVPVCTFFITALSEHNCTTSNYYIRNKSRIHIILKRIIRIIILSVIVSALLVIISIVISGLFASEFINWDEYGSYFFIKRGILSDIDFISFLFLTFVKLLFPIIFFSSLECTLSLICKKTFSFLIVVLLSASNSFGYIKFMIDYAFNRMNETDYFSFSSAVLIFAIFPILTLIIVLFAAKLVKRKDFIIK